MFFILIYARVKRQDLLLPRYETRAARIRQAKIILELFSFAWFITGNVWAVYCGIMRAGLNALRLDVCMDHLRLSVYRFPVDSVCFNCYLSPASPGDHAFSKGKPWGV